MVVVPLNSPPFYCESHEIKRSTRLATRSHRFNVKICVSVSSVLIVSFLAIVEASSCTIPLHSSEM